MSKATSYPTEEGKTRFSQPTNACDLDYELTSPPPPRYEPSGAGIDPELERLLEQDPGLIDVKAKSFNPFNGDGEETHSGSRGFSNASWYRGGGRWHFL